MSKSRIVAVVAAAALVTTVGGVGATAAAGLIGSNDIKDNSIRSKDIQDGAIRLTDLSDGAQTKLQGATGATGAKGDIGAKGDTGAKGAKGDTGAAGADGAGGVSGYQIVNLYTRNNGGGLGTALAVGEVRQVTVACPPGSSSSVADTATGNTGPGHDLTVRESNPSAVVGEYNAGQFTAWSVTLQNETMTAQHAQAFAVCITAN